MHSLQTVFVHVVALNGTCKFLMNKVTLQTMNADKTRVLIKR